MREKFAEYLRAYILDNWDENLYKNKRQKNIWDFIIDSLNKIPDQEFYTNSPNIYIQTIKTLFDTNHTWDKIALTKKLGEEGNLNKCKSIENFIHKKTLPEILKLEQIAVLFHSPIKTYIEYVKIYEKNPIHEKHIIHTENLGNKPLKANRVKPNFFQTHRKPVLFSLFLLFVFISVFAAVVNNKGQEDIKIQNDSLGYVRNLLNRKFEVNPLDIKKMAVLQTQTAPSEINSSVPIGLDGLRFETFRIYNNECITSDMPWGFETDPAGEDMCSKKYGFPYCNSITLLKKSVNQTPIANKKMIIRFKIINPEEKTVKLSDLALYVDSVILANGKNISYNILQERGIEDERIKIVLNSKQTKYAFYNQIYEIKPNCEAFFILEIEFPKLECTDNIYKFHFELAFDDNRILPSDKKYFLACKNI